jgi:hypothetical protein
MILRQTGDIDHPKTKGWIMVLAGLSKACGCPRSGMRPVQAAARVLPRAVMVTSETSHSGSTGFSA